MRRVLLVRQSENAQCNEIEQRNVSSLTLVDTFRALLVVIGSEDALQNSCEGKQGYGQ